MVALRARGGMAEVSRALASIERFLSAEPEAAVCST